MCDTLKAMKERDFFMLYSAVFMGILLPFWGTVLGGVLAWSGNRLLHSSALRTLNAMAAGVMCAAALFSLLVPAVQLSPASVPWLPPVAGFLLGGLCILLLERLLPKAYTKKDGSLLMLAVTLHNLPEGMAVGVALAGLHHTGIISPAGAMALSLGIAIQNIPEGAIIYAPMHARGESQKKALLYSVLSGVVEPIGALITFFSPAFSRPCFPIFSPLPPGPCCMWWPMKCCLPQREIRPCPPFYLWFLSPQ